jgi:hypothetical protein
MCIGNNRTSPNWENDVFFFPFSYTCANELVYVWTYSLESGVSSCVAYYVGLLSADLALERSFFFGKNI